MRMVDGDPATTGTAEPEARVWSEFVGFRELCRGPVLGMLADGGARLLVAVTPRNPVLAVSDVVRACADSGVSFGLWPLLDDDQGRWANESNVTTFASFVLRLLDRLGATGALPEELAFDLEPNIDEMRRALRSPRAWARALPPKSRHEAAARAFGRLVADVRAREIGVFAAVTPLVLLGARSGHPGPWERLLGTPIDDVGFDRVNVMLYTSMLEGYTAGRLRRTDALWLLWKLSLRARERWGETAGVSVGVAGSGALGDESPYRSRRELAEDVAFVRGAGVRDLALFNLGGVLARPPSAEWLEILRGTAPAEGPPPRTRRAAALLSAIDGASRLLQAAMDAGDRSAARARLRR